MIHVDRSRIAKPAVLDSRKAMDERAAATRAFMTDKVDRQRRFEFRVYREPEIRIALDKLFNGKCAYCETKIAAVSTIDTELYRPKAGVSERPEHLGYWWLASDWDNLLTSCVDCNRTRVHAGERTGKGNRFPLANEDKRAFKPGEEAHEEPLLLDPCRDHPEEHLVFDALGRVVSDTRRGQTTISVVGLNRRHLVDARKGAATGIQGTIAILGTLLQDEQESRKFGAPPTEGVLERAVAQIRELQADSQEFAGMKRQLLRPLVDRLRTLGVSLDAPASVASTPIITKARKASARREFLDFETSQSSFSLATEQGRETYKSERRLIERVVIHNVKAIRDLDLDLTDYGSGRTPWLMLLGENGTGKSTILQAIALTLIGASAFKRLGDMGAIHSSDFVRYRCKSGTVSVKLSGFVRPHLLTFKDDHVEFTSPTLENAIVSFGASGCEIHGTGWEPQMILLGYGATRLLPRSSSPQVTSTGDTYSRVDNLFDPFVPLRDADSWMVAVKDSNQLEFDTATLILKDLLSLAANARFIVEKGRVMVVDHGEKVSLRQLSDGYQSVVATAVDILEVMTKVWPNLLEAEGIVLLDEIGAHLHPTWKMRIVGAIRRAAPAVQFVTSTHDPLCLRGLGAGEVVVMQRDENQRVRALTALPSPADFRIDQLLTSAFFGLNSTADPDTDEAFTKYYALLALPDRSPAQDEELAGLTASLKDRRHLGTTPREHLMYEAVDQIVARYKQTPVEPIADLRQEAVDAVTRVWAESDDPPGMP